MNQITPSTLAQLLPVQPNQVIFQYEITLDSTYKSPQVNGAVSIDISDLPQQMSQPLYQTPGNQQWNVGFNVFKQGSVIQYQAFYWGGSTPPPQGQLESRGSYQQAGPIVSFNPNAPLVASVNIPSYDWLTCSVQPLICKFAMTALNGIVTPQSPTYSSAIVRTASYSNTSSGPVTYKPIETYDETQTVLSTITDTHSFEAGLKVSESVSVNWVIGSASYTIEVNLKYNFTKTTISTDSISKIYSFSDPIEFTLTPN